MENLNFRYATETDSALILEFIRELAKYENMIDEVVATEELLREWIFEKKKAEVIFALEDEKEVGFALFFHNFSTFLGCAGIYLEHFGIDMSGQCSKLISDIPAPDIVITMGCNVQCPYIPCKERCDWGLEDPTGKSDEEFIKTADLIKEKILDLMRK